MASFTLPFLSLPAIPTSSLSLSVHSSASKPKLTRVNPGPFLSHTINKTLLWPLTSPQSRKFSRATRVTSQLRHPIIAPGDHWGLWTALFATGAFGLWSEKTEIGGMVSAALVSTLVGLAASNLGIIPFEAPAYSIVLEFLLPLAIPLLLFRADLRSVMRSTGTLLLAFLLGSVATMVGTLVAFLVVPMRSLGSDNWKIAAALMGSYIGGSVNYVAISEALGVSPSVLAAGVAADNVICALYFMVLFALASKIPPEALRSTNDVSLKMESNDERKLPVLETATALATSFVICKASTYLTGLCGIKGGSLPAITATVVVLATVLPTHFAYLAPAGDTVALLLMQVFFAVIGASGSIWNVINTAPSIFMFALVQVTVHLAVVLGLGKLFFFDLKLILLASNANIGGPTTAGGMARANNSRWNGQGQRMGFFGSSCNPCRHFWSCHCNVSWHWFWNDGPQTHVENANSIFHRFVFLFIQSCKSLRLGMSN